MEWDLLNLPIWPGLIWWAVGVGIVFWVGTLFEKKDHE